MSENTKRLSEIEQRHARVRHGDSWEWSDCFDPESDICGLVMVRIPSEHAWHKDGYQYLMIADMEWATADDLGAAEFIANAPRDVDWLIDRVHELEDELKRSTTVSGYSVQYPQPEDACCAAVAAGQECTCQHEPDDGAYLADWRERVDRDELYHPLQPGFWEPAVRACRDGLAGYNERDFYTMQERLASGE